MRRYYHESQVGVTAGGLALLAGTVTALTFGVGKTVDANYGEEKARDYVEQNGYTDVDHQETNIMFVGVQGCDSNDAAGYEFTAVSPNDTPVEVTVCKGIFKGATLRQG